ncbi:flagellar biosynthetic protein FliQ, partial [Clostridioides difficile]
LIVSLVVGLLISVFQATTQIQEQTLTFVPKLIAILLVVAIGGSWMLHTLISFTSEIFNMISLITK